MANLHNARFPDAGPNVCWSMDWMYDRLFEGRRIQGATNVDNISRESLSIWVGRQAKAAVSEFSSPLPIRLEDGSGLTFKEMDLRPAPTAPSSTSRDPENQRTTPKARPSTAGFPGNV